ncbi:hypothetical protein G7046_g8495 [Stylonectria norvegica]|nr:hypothetical protein G7046_g8495 [Stylonectria norvegica]
MSRRSGDHAEETFEEFSARFEKEFDGVQDIFELQRNLNNAFAYDLVPSPSVIAAALKAARRVNDFGTAVRIFEVAKEVTGPLPTVDPLATSTTRNDINRLLFFATRIPFADFVCSLLIGIKSKVENKGQYEQYLEELKPLREELGVPLKEDLYPEEK